MTATFSRKGEGLKRALFLCENNFTASRFCEELFNSLVRDQGLNWQAASRSYSPSPARRHLEPMSTEAVAALRRLGVAPVNHRRLPLEVTPFDLETSFVVVAIAPRAQYSAITRAWPVHAGQIEFWRCNEQPGDDFGDLVFSVTALLDVLLARSSVGVSTAPQLVGAGSGNLAAGTRYSQLSHVQTRQRFIKDPSETHRTR